MAKAAEAQASEVGARKGAASRVAGNLRNHRTLCVGLLYLVTIIGVVVFVARL